jgi:hypothetical protein
MSIILAIEPDRRRAAQLTGMARAHLRAELLVAPTASQAVEALGGRVPDVLLTAPLLPSHEEAAMADHLRQLGPAAAHVQTLTIPLLAGGSGERDRPVLSAFRRERINRTEPEGCDPAVFAEQITEYLREAQERRDAPAPPPRAVETPVEAPQAVRLGTTNERFQRLLAAAVEDTPDDFSDFALEVAPKPPSKAPIDDDDESDAPATTFVAGSGRDIKLSRSISDSDADDEIPTFERNLSVTANGPVPFDDDGSPQAITSVKVVGVTIGNRGSAIDRKVPPARSVKAPGAATAGLVSKRQRRAKPVENEWGFFDPNQCGFPALIAKLDEIASRETDN